MPRAKGDRYTAYVGQGCTIQHSDRETLQPATVIAVEREIIVAQLDGVRFDSFGTMRYARETKHGDILRFRGRVEFIQVAPGPGHMGIVDAGTGKRLFLGFRKLWPLPAPIFTSPR